MVAGDGGLAWLERTRSTLYLAAGLVLVVFVANTALRTYSGISYPAVHQFVGPTGFLLGTIGLLGLYRSVAASGPRLAQLAAAVAALAAIDWTITAAAGVLETAGIIPEHPTFIMVTGFVALISMVLAYGLFGIASLRTDAYRGLVSGLLLLEAVTFVVMTANSAAGLGFPLLVFEVSHLVVYLGLAITLRGTETPDGLTEPARDPTV